ncbi:MAG: peptide chain release factor N(5)-glutamine methyltransferase [Bacteroidia bacterium]
MKIASNNIKDIFAHYKKQLSSIYDDGELKAVMHLAFEHILGFSRTDMSTRSEENVSESDLLKLHFICKRLAKHEPIQYIIGETEFYRLRFKVNPHVLIPRQETEELVDLILKDIISIKHLNPNFSILDIGTGSGCIAITLKKQILNADVYAMDISEEALDVALQNAELNNVDVKFIHGDILQSAKLSLPVSSFDVIISNPPYITRGESEAMDARVKEHEPQLALFVENDDPLLFYKAICAFAKQKLSPQGKLYFELNAAHGQDAKALMLKEGFKNVELIRDLSGKDRMLMGEK